MTERLTPEAAVDRLEALYEEATAALRAALARYLAGGAPPTPEERARFVYPEIAVTYAPERAAPRNRRAYAKFSQPGLYRTTVTQPGFFRRYLLDQLRPLTTEYDATLDVRPSTQEIPYPYVLDGAADLTADARTPAELARHFPVPLLSLVGDEVADGIMDGLPQGTLPLALFDAVRVDYSLRRLIHYTGTDWRSVQPWILLTNYHRYVDQFVGWAMAEIAAGRAERLVAPGGLTVTAETLDGGAARIAASAWHRYQMPAYHLERRGTAGITLVNIGVGPSNAKNITDHLAVLRPHCWLMIGHCGGLRQAQEIGDYVLAHAYLRRDRILDALVPPEIPIPALAEIQTALQEACAAVTGMSGEALKHRLRTGTVVTNNDRNWELRYTQEARLFNLSRAIAVDMESGTIAAQGYRLRVPYGTLLCVSDKPLHGEIKLPGAANAFYASAVAQHLLVGLDAVERLKRAGGTIHSRKLRSFDEPPFR
ncbi:AMP nucleosidase [Phreatobacter cathodiphilus]|uniref:AMP nucleosidase n=1 Tax=Phreatobacter cathodiphilus TaxID=1868589 RepID=A0A2S0NEC2_9HYPH|nr:AMP nucleosidase [Phreatobacter cathodiphilus]AVO46514.1 AMP nucleosidase [Phreatobacter cathodiphilus]